ncbi:MAG TPA: GAF domain-containing protein, partial [Anaerolineales bacterium]
MSNDDSRKRVKSLFAGIQQLASSEPPNGNGHADTERQAVAVSPAPVITPIFLLQEVETLRARVVELEAQLNESELRKSSAPILYEKEEVGFAYTGDQVMPIREAQPQGQNEAELVKTPLVASGKAIGEVQIAPPAEHPFTEEDLELAKAVAQQASVQIQNLRLLDATERARAEAEAATRRFMHENWDSFLDGINQAEQIAYVYDQSSVRPFVSPLRVDGGIQEVVKVLDEHVG